MPMHMHMHSLTYVVHPCMCVWTGMEMCVWNCRGLREKLNYDWLEDSKSFPPFLGVINSQTRRNHNIESKRNHFPQFQILLSTMNLWVDKTCVCMCVENYGRHAQRVCMSVHRTHTINASLPLIISLHFVYV